MHERPLPQLHCSVPECDRCVSEGRRYCFTHWKRAQRGQQLDTPIRRVPTRAEAVLEAAIALADATADDDAAWTRLEKSLLNACERWMRSRGWAPPGAAEEHHQDAAAPSSASAAA